MSVLTDFLYDRINQLLARKKTIERISGSKDPMKVLTGKGFDLKDIPKIEADIKETEHALWGIRGELIPDRITEFIVWTHSDEGSRWYYDKSYNAWTQEGWRNRTTNEHFREYLKDLARKQRKNIPYAISHKNGPLTLN